MINLIRNLFLTLRFFQVTGSIVLVLLLSYAFPFLFIVGKAMLLLIIAVVLADIIILFNPKVRITCRRVVPNLFSLGSENGIRVELRNKYKLGLKATLVDELPSQFQQRNFSVKLQLPSEETYTINYTLRPTVRGEYSFGKVHLYLRSMLGLVERRQSFPFEKMIPVYPSILEMKNLELRAFPKISNYQGIKKIRRLGHSYEFEQIKNYVLGDDFRSINWKATGRKGNLMVNQYEDERAQQVYTIIDKSRAMKMPFNKMSLLDYAINTSLVISNIALHKQDRAGLITFADKINTTIRAERSKAHLKKILEALYNEKEKNSEANYEALYLGIKNFIKGRSLILLYTNFESFYALERILPVLRKINRTHLLVVIFFENTEIIDYTKESVKNVEEIYYQTIAQKFVAEKSKIISELKQYGIQAVFSRPEELSVNSINKYLELKSRGLI